MIKGANGTEFLFAGLSDQTAESIKSYEGVDKVWVEEAQAVSDRSWTILIPTIRKNASEIWVTLNLELDTDPTYVRFIENPPPDSFVVQINYYDNPWFPEVLEKERQHAEATLPKAEYENIWLGKCKPSVAGAIYADEIAAAHDKGRITNVPYDSGLKVHAIFDLGWNDACTVIFAQKHLSSLRCIGYMEESGKTFDWFSAEMKKKGVDEKMPWNWGQVYFPHDGRQHTQQTGKTDTQTMRDLGWDVRELKHASIEEGIRIARRTFPNVSFDKAGTTKLVEALKRYRRNVPTTTGEPGTPVHNQYSHGADAFRYLCRIAPELTNETWGGKLTYQNLAIA